MDRPLRIALRLLVAVEGLARVAVCVNVRLLERVRRRALDAVEGLVALRLCTLAEQ